MRRLRRHRTALVFLGLVAALTLVTALAGGLAQHAGALDPQNPEPEGARALAQVLQDQGVEVRIARGEPHLRAERIDADTTVVVSQVDALGQSTFENLVTHTEDAGSVVVLGPGTAVLQGLDLAPRAMARSGTTPAACADPLFDGLVLDADGRSGDSQSVVVLDAEGCFRTDGGALFAQQDRFWVLTPPAVLSNDQILAADNAAVAVRLLGQHPRVVWYVADPADTAVTDGVSIRVLLPPWFLPVLAVLGLGFLAYLLVRARRLGPLATEPLPVVVRAVESTLGRGRLYHRARARDHAAGWLRRGSRSRLAVALGLSHRASEDELREALHGRGIAPQTTSLLTDHPVRHEAALVELARELHHLEDQVRPS